MFSCGVMALSALRRGFFLGAGIGGGGDSSLQ
jgi:hypothetical protein